MKLCKRFVAVLIISLACSAFLLTTTAGAFTGPGWPQWRGPSGQGISNEKNLPEEWTTTKNIKWKAAIPGRGHSSPIVWGDRIFLTTAIEGEIVPGHKAIIHYDEGKEFLHPDSVGADHKHQFRVLCIDRKTGKIVWDQLAFEGTPYDNRHRKSSFAASTPATDGQTVYAFFGSEGLYAYDMKGKLRWKTDLGKLGTVGMGT
jgi:outer membrane protein assembly factor BamB